MPLAMHGEIYGIVEHGIESVCTEITAGAESAADVRWNIGDGFVGSQSGMLEGAMKI